MKIKKIILICLAFLLIIACNKDVSDSTPDIIKENWYKTTNINKNTYSIEEPQSSQGNVSYLLTGDSKAIMFDTGSGENKGQSGSKIIYKIKELTSLPITLILSHFHFDHNQNIAEFDKVAFPDLSFLKQKVVNNTYTFTSNDLFIGNYPNKIAINEWLPINIDIDLGNRIIQVLNIPGHTSESVAIIDKTNKIAFLGDYLYNGPLFLFDTNDISTYKETIDYLIAILDSDYKLFGAHGKPEINYSTLKKLQDFLICIQDNNCKPISKQYWNRDVLVYEDNGMEIILFL